MGNIRLTIGGVANEEALEAVLLVLCLDENVVPQSGSRFCSLVIVKRVVDERPVQVIRKNGPESFSVSFQR